MIQRISVYESTTFDPYRNLAIEQQLLESVGEGQCILYLWQNQNTVVIGRNQNPWKECRTTLLQQEGGHLARRLSGGGAVFHDLGNLNFTFLMPQPEYDVDRQLSVIQQAVSSLGIPAEKSGRNDILSGGRKFSGNAFYKNGKQAYHHGTLLVDVDMDKLSRYLNPSKAKLKAKGVDSVRSRVVNLKALNPEITIPMLKEALIRGFSQVYGLPVQRIPEETVDPGRIEELTLRNGSWQWNFGQKLPFSVECEERFPWGGVQLQLQIDSGIIRQAKAYSDAMDWSVAPELESCLTGCRFDRSDMERVIRSAGFAQSEDLCGMLQALNL